MVSDWGFPVPRATPLQYGFDSSNLENIFAGAADAAEDLGSLPRGSEYWHGIGRRIMDSGRRCGASNSCPPGFYCPVSGRKVCQKCSESLKNCRICEDAIQCTLCRDGYTPVDGKCTKIDPSCEDWEDGACEECNRDFYIDSSGRCASCLDVDCGEGRYQIRRRCGTDDFESFDGCTACSVANCASCPGGTCEKCAGGWFLKIDGATRTCEECLASNCAPTGEFYDQGECGTDADPSATGCAKCSVDNCASCPENAKCDKCLNTFFLTDGNCQPCSSFPLPPSTSPPPTYETEGFVFSFIVPGYNPLTFNGDKQKALCAEITSAQNLPNKMTLECSIQSASSFNTTNIIASGFAYAKWYVVPTPQEVGVLVALRDAWLRQLTYQPATVFKTFPGTVPNCACSGLATVTKPSTSPYTYTTTVLAQGPLQCDSRLSYPGNTVDYNDPYGIINQVGIDDGTIVAGNLGKFCSSPPVEGGVLGQPGVGSCITYGVIAQPDVANDLGKLCSAQPIAGLPLDAAVPTPIAEGVTVGGQCQPIGIDNYINKPCSIPAVAGGLYSALNTFTCNVGSSFRSQPNAPNAYGACAVLPQRMMIPVPPDLPLGCQ